MGSGKCPYLNSTCDDYVDFSHICFCEKKMLSFCKVWLKKQLYNEGRQIELIFIPTV